MPSFPRPPPFPLPYGFKERFRYMKKLLGILILTVITLSVMTGALLVTADSSPRYEMTDQNVETGGDFSLVVSIKDNPGIISLKFKVNYDKNVLKLNSVEAMGLLEGFTNPSPQISSPYTLRWSNSLWADPLSPGSKASGELVKLNFTVLSDKETTTKVTVAHDESYDNSGKQKEFVDASANITVQKKFKVTFLDEDGKTVIYSAKYLVNEPLVAPDDPTKPSDDTFKYHFAAWTPEVAETVTGDLTYKATYSAEPLSNDTGLKSLEIVSGTLSPAFDPEVFKYTATVPYTTKNLEINCVTSNEFATYILDAPELVVGENRAILTVVAENGDSQTFEITVTREKDPYYVPDKDATLKSLTVSGGLLSPAFLSTQKDYILYVEYAQKKITFTAVPKSDKARGVSGDGTVSFLGERGEVKIVCTAENGDEMTYTVKLVRLPEYNGEIPEITFPKDEPDPTPGENTGATGSTDNPVTPSEIDPGENNNEDPKEPEAPKFSKTVVIILVCASLCAIISLGGIVILLSVKLKNQRN